MQVVILAAGRGKRMGNVSKEIHKSLLPINDSDSFLSNILNHLNEFQISKLIIVTGYLSNQIEENIKDYQINIKIIKNKLFDKDVNIYSMKLALDNLSSNETTLILEADTYIDTLAFREILNQTKKDKSIWFTRGMFNSSQNGGILKSKDNLISDIKIVPNYLEKYSSYSKLLGIQTISSNHFLLYKKLVDIYCKKTIQQYYLIPWIENLKKFESYSFDLNKYKITSVNTYIEYKEFVESLQNISQNQKLEIKLIDISKLKKIEDIIDDRICVINEKILKDNIWSKPIIVEKNNFLILDGHHRFEVATKNLFKKIPAILVDYADVDVWSLREDQHVEKEIVIKRALNGKIFPNKTVKHKFPFVVPNCKIKIEKLKK